MNRQQKIYGVFLFLLVVLWAWLEQSGRNTNWEETFYASHKIPYGTYILKENISNGDNIVETTHNNRSFYELFNGKDSIDTGSCLFVFTQNFAPDSLSLLKLNEFICRGNTVFIAARQFSHELFDQYGVSLKNIPITPNAKPTQLTHFLQSKSDSCSYRYQKMNASSYFEIENNNATIIRGKENGLPCFLEIAQEKGRLLIHSQPLAFTNYHILYNNHQYASLIIQDALRSTSKIIWDNYHNSYFEGNRSFLRNVVSRSPLRYALYFSLALVLVFIIFNGKRKQRVIPIITQNKNLSLGFIDTIGRLYFQHGNHKDIIEKQYMQFNHFVRTKFHIIHSKNNLDFPEQLASKSGVDLEIIKNIYTNYQNLRKKEKVTESDLHIFYNQINRFHKNIK